MINFLCTLINNGDENDVIACFQTHAIPQPGDIINLSKPPWNLEDSSMWQVIAGARDWRIYEIDPDDTLFKINQIFVSCKPLVYIPTVDA